MKHPNAATSLIAGGGGGSAVYAILNAAGVHVTPEVAIWIAAAASTVVLFVGRNGLQGVARIIWRGTGQQRS